MRAPIKTIFLRHTGKVTDKWSSYLDTWDHIFEPYRERKVNLLEIGVQNGGSLEVWAEAFKSARNIIGCDVNAKCRDLEYADPRISVVVGDINSDETREIILNKASCLDIIIDDGSHVSDDTIISFVKYFQYLANDGIYVIEDLHTSYWQEFGGGLLSPHSSVSFFKMLVDIINFEHWHNSGIRSTLLKNYSTKLGLDFDDGMLAKIHSIEFLNSLCIITKAQAEFNVLGDRRITGTEASVENAILRYDNEPISENYHSEEMFNKFDFLSFKLGGNNDSNSDEIIANSIILEEIEYQTTRNNELMSNIEAQISLLGNQINNINEYISKNIPNIEDLHSPLHDLKNPSFNKRFILWITAPIRWISYYIRSKLINRI